MTHTELPDHSNDHEKVRRQFSANVSHELKTPLTGILGYAEMLSSGMARPEDTRRFIERIRCEAEQMIQLVDDIIMLSQLDETERLPYTEPVDLGEVAVAVKEALTFKAQEHGVSLRLDAPETLLKGNRSLLYDLLYNLLDNSVKYNRPGGSAQVIVSQHDGRTIIEVSDTGIGIPPKHQDRVLERFYRVDKSRSKKTGGTGLGLSIVKHIAAVHDGTVELNSTPGKGTTVRVVFGHASA